MIWNWALNNELVDRPLAKKGLRYPHLRDRPPFQTMAEIERKIPLGGLSEQEIADLWDSAFLNGARPVQPSNHHVNPMAFLIASSNA
jgi:hypothetical protein